MKNFSQNIKNIENILKKKQFNVSDIDLLLSSDSSKYIEIIKNLARSIKIRNFGQTARIYRPLYLSNYCVNDCLYCGCASSVAQKRKILSEDEIYEECKAIKSEKIDSVLIVSGEDKIFCNVEYLSSAAKIAKTFFSFLAIEAGPFDKTECKKLLKAGVDSFVLYQETYDKPRYFFLHRGPKRDFQVRLNAIQTAADAGFKSVGMGILLGIADYRNDAVNLAKHAEAFRKKNWDCSLSFSFPRLRPPSDEKFPEFKVSEEDLEKVFLAFRLIFPDAEINVSTRESIQFRDKIIQYAATTISAASATIPGAYSSKSNEDELAQFEVNDKRTVSEISLALQALNIQPIFKYWDKVFSHQTS